MIPRDILKKKDGFTLLEVLVAFVLLASVVTIIFQLFSANLRVISISEDYALATVRAESKMREILDMEDLVEKTWSETSPDGYTFRVAVTNAYESRTESLPVKTLEINLAVSWKKGEKEKTMALTTLKTVRQKV